MVVERGAARADDDGRQLELGVLAGWLARRAGASQSGGAWNSPRFFPLTGQRCDPGTKEIVPASAEVSSSAIQQVIISAGSR